MTDTVAPVRLPRQIRYVALADVTDAEDNPRAHESLDVVKRSIRRFGFVDGAVHDGRTDRIIAGHGRKQALVEMREAGEDVPEGVLVLDDGQWSMPVQVGWSSATDEEAQILLVNLNRLVETGGWVQGGLNAMLVELRSTVPLAEFELTGWTSPQLDEMLAEAANQEYEALEDPADLDDAPAAPEPADAVCVVGDVWVIGEHRLVVGDSTDLSVVRAALGGAPAQLVFTDPPYGVSYVGQRGMTIANDDLSASDLGRFLVALFAVMKEVLIPGGTFYVCSPSGNLETEFRLALREVGLLQRQQLVWVKDSLVLGRWDYQSQHETIFYGWQVAGEVLEPPHFDPEHETLIYGWKDGAAHEFSGGRKQTSVWLYPKPKSSPLHPTSKPVALVRRAVGNSSTAGLERGRVLDVCGGSGSTMVACQTLGRPSAMVELDPPYADVIVQRMLDQFGIVGVRESDGFRWPGKRKGSA